MAVMTHRFTSSATVNLSRPAPKEELPLPTSNLPTSNNLDAAQRSRYIRTARKLGKVLGTTPLVMDTNSTLLNLSPCASRISPTLSAPSTPSTSHFDLSLAPSRKSIDSSKQPSQHGHSRSEAIGSDVLAPLPIFREASHHNRLSLHQPILRLPVFSSIGAFYGSPGSAPESSSAHLNSPTELVDTEPQPPNCSRSPASPSSTPSPPSLPTTPPNEPIESPLPDDLDLYAYADDEDDEAETRLRKRRMDKLTRHLGERVPSELVTGSMRGRSSISGACHSMYPTSLETTTSTAPTSKITRRVSVMSSAVRRKNTVDGNESGTGYRSGSDRSERLVKNQKDSTRHLVEEDWTPQAYEDVVKRLRRLK